MATECGSGRDGELPGVSGLVAQQTAVEEESSHGSGGVMRSKQEVPPCTRFYNEWRQCTCTWTACRVLPSLVPLGVLVVMI